MTMRNQKTRRRNETPLRKKTPDGDVTVIDINDYEFLRRYVSDQGKILPKRLSGLNASQQRKIKNGIRRARTMGLLM